MHADIFEIKMRACTQKHNIDACVFVIVNSRRTPTHTRKRTRKLRDVRGGIRDAPCLRTAARCRVVSRRLAEMSVELL